MRWTLLGGLVPGLGLLAAGRKRSGRAVLALLAAPLVGAACYVVLHGGPGPAVLELKSWALVPAKLTRLAVGVAVLASIWILLALASHVSLLRRGRLQPWQAALASCVCAATAVAVAVPAGRGAQYALIQRDVLTSVFSATPVAVNTASAGARPRAVPSAAADPWRGTERVNVLLMGSDAGDDRIGLRPDSLILASIAPHSGDTVLFSLPRNLQGVPFPEGSPMHEVYPNGFRCYETRNGKRIPACLLNAVWTYGEAEKSRFGDDPKPGLTATEDAVEGIMGLRPDYYVMLNLAGFKEFVDAIGGVDVTVHKRLPIGGTGEDSRRRDYHVAVGGWIEPGRQELDGYHALWFARSRWSSDDYDRMRRQRCVIAAAAQQADPLTLVRRFPQVAAAIKGNFETDIPLAQLEAWADLALRVRSAGVRSLAFTDEVIDTSDPDIDHIHSLVRKALRPPARSASPAPSASGSSLPTATSPAAGGSSDVPPPQASGTPDPSPSTKPPVSVAQRVDDVC
ncbi:MAG: LCP family protein [Kineosporiaceae bacterium]